MSDLKVGDCVLSKQNDGTFKACDPIYFFGHAEGASLAPYHQLHLSSGKMISLSATHFIHTAKTPSATFVESELKHARKVNVGDWIWDTDGLSQVTNRTVKTLPGLYNPYTLSGNIVVDGVVASAHSHWIFDDYVPDAMLHHLPSLYQAAFYPGRLLFWAAGPPAADFLGLNNPAVSAETWIYYTNFATEKMALIGTLTCIAGATLKAAHSLVRNR